MTKRGRFNNLQFGVTHISVDCHFTSALCKSLDTNTKVAEQYKSGIRFWFFILFAI